MLSFPFPFPVPHPWPAQPRLGRPLVPPSINPKSQPTESPPCESHGPQILLWRASPYREHHPTDRDVGPVPPWVPNPSVPVPPRVPNQNTGQWAGMGALRSLTAEGTVSGFVVTTVSCGTSQVRVCHGNMKHRRYLEIPVAQGEYPKSNRE